MASSFLFLCCQGLTPLFPSLLSGGDVVSYSLRTQEQSERSLRKHLHTPTPTPTCLLASVPRCCLVAHGCRVGEPCRPSPSPTPPHTLPRPPWSTPWWRASTSPSLLQTQHFLLYWAIPTNMQTHPLFLESSQNISGSNTISSYCLFLFPHANSPR